MLVLVRKVNESIKIGDNVIVTVLEVTPEGRVKLGFKAPRSVPIHRTEVIRKQEESNGQG